MVLILRLAIVAACVALLLVVLHRDVLLEFDESNELLISARPISEIFEILSHEQNFPLHYIITHCWYLFDAGTLPIKLFNFGIWLASVFVVARIVSHFAKTPASRLALLLCVVSIPYFHYYAIFMRMYGMANLAIALQILCLIEKYSGEQERPRREWILRIAQLACTALHPIGIVVSLGTTLTELVLGKLRRPGMPLLWASINVAVFAINVLVKSDPERIYLGSGVAYIQTVEGGLASHGPLYYLIALYNTSPALITPWQYGGFVLALFVVAHAFGSLRLYRDPKFVVLAVPAFCLLAIPMVLRNSFSDHHAAFFVVPFALFAITTLHESWSRGSPVSYAVIGLALVFVVVTWLPLQPAWLRALIAITIVVSTVMFLVPRATASKGKWIGGCLIGVVALCHAKNTVSAIQYRSHRDTSLAATCEVFARGLPDGVRLASDDLLFTTYSVLNIVSRCVGDAMRPRTFLLENTTVVDITSLGPRERLLEQAIRGGTLDSAFAVQRMLQTPLLAPVLAKHRPERIWFFMPLNSCGSGIRRITIPELELHGCDARVFVFRRRAIEGHQGATGEGPGQADAQEVVTGRR